MATILSEHWSIYRLLCTNAGTPSTLSLDPAILALLLCGHGGRRRLERQAGMGVRSRYPAPPMILADNECLPVQKQRDGNHSRLVRSLRSVLGFVGLSTTSTPGPIGCTFLRDMGNT